MLNLKLFIVILKRVATEAYAISPQRTLMSEMFEMLLCVCVIITGCLHVTVLNDVLR